MLRFVRVAILILVTAAAGTSAALGLTVTVGAAGDPACQFQSLQAGLDALAASGAEARILRIARPSAESTLYPDVSVSITGHVEVLGGFADCSASTPTPGERTILQGATGLGSVVTVEIAGADRQAIVLENLVLERGDAERGGGLAIAGPADVQLASVIVLNNDAGEGGGIFVDGAQGATLRLTRQSGVNGNRAVRDEGFGGGIACLGEGTVHAFSGGIFGNVAGGALAKGGGIALQECTVVLGPGFTVQGNRAMQGGGIYAEGGADVLALGDLGSARIVANVVEGRETLAGQGGGIFLDDAGTTLEGSALVLERNRSLDGTGGALFVRAGAFARLRSGTLAAACAVSGGCSRVVDNEAPDGAIAAVHDARLTFAGTELRENVSPDGAAIFAVAGAAGTTAVDLEGVALTRNLAISTIDMRGPSRLRLRHTTAAGNLGLEDLVVLIADGGPGAPELELRNSILWEPTAARLILKGDDSPVTADCLVVSDLEGLPAGAFALELDPELVDLANGDLHLTAGSPAIDLCPELAPALRDLDGDLRGFDLPAVPDHLPGSFFDAGADELVLGNEVFADGFESGDTGPWTTAVP